MSYVPFRALGAGDVIGVIAPAGPASAEAVARAPDVITAMGYRARFFPGCHQRLDYLAGDDDCRLADLHAAFLDPEVAAVLCLRGGYGSGRLLDRVDWPTVFAHAKPLIGYSDITALHAQFSNAGIPSFHGPMLTSDLLDSQYSPDDLGFDLLRGGIAAGTVLHATRAEPILHIPGYARGRLVGGNLSIIASLLGTPWALDTRDAILFLEEVGEAPYRIDRLLLQLRLAGVLAQVNGLVLGSFSGADSPQAVITDYLGKLGKPVLSGWPAGHSAPNTLLPLGCEVALDAEFGTLTISTNVVDAAY